MVGSPPESTFLILLAAGIPILVLGILGIVFGTIRRLYHPDARIIRDGAPAEATITRNWPTNVRFGNRFGIGIEPDVRRPGYPPYTARARALVSILDVSRFQVGAVIPVKVDPNKPQRVYPDLPG
jgi:hypothetical protein